MPGGLYAPILPSPNHHIAAASSMEMKRPTYECLLNVLLSSHAEKEPATRSGFWELEDGHNAGIVSPFANRLIRAHGLD